MADEKKCPKCGGGMVLGHVSECNLGRSQPIHPGVVGTWLEGPSFCERPRPSGIPVCSFRCSGCGFLESYAASVAE